VSVFLPQNETVLKQALQVVNKSFVCLCFLAESALKLVSSLGDPHQFLLYRFHRSHTGTLLSIFEPLSQFFEAASAFCLKGYLGVLLRFQLFQLLLRLSQRLKLQSKQEPRTAGAHLSGCHLNTLLVDGPSNKGYQLCWIHTILIRNTCERYA